MADDYPPLLQAIAPATGEALGSVPVASARAVRAAVAEAAAVQGLWAQLRLATAPGTWRARRRP